MSTPISYLERMCADSPDPWDFESRWYDARKHALATGVPASVARRSGLL